MTSSTTDHRATGRGRTHLRCIESSHNDIINTDHRATGRGRTHLRCIESSHNDIINIVTGMVEQCVKRSSYHCSGMVEVAKSRSQSYRKR